MQSIKTYRCCRILLSLIHDYVTFDYVTCDYMTFCDVIMWHVIMRHVIMWRMIMWHYVTCDYVTLLWHAYMWHYVTSVYVTCELMWHVPLSFFSCVHLFFRIRPNLYFKRYFERKKGHNSSIFLWHIVCNANFQVYISKNTVLRTFWMLDTAQFRLFPNYLSWNPASLPW